MYFLKEKLTHIPKRIISLVPSQTELLYYLELETETIGITKFCVHPPIWFRNKKRIGGTKSIHIDQVRDLKPDLIIANKEENVKEQVEALTEIAPVWMSDINNLDHSIYMIREIGRITNREEKAKAIAHNILEKFNTLSPLLPPRTALYLIWRNPWMTIGQDTFIHDMMLKMGLQNVYNNETRYPAISSEDIQSRNPEVILLSSEPYPFKEKHIRELQLLVPDAKIMLVDGEMFSWYGSRLLLAPDYFNAILQSL